MENKVEIKDDVQKEKIMSEETATVMTAYISNNTIDHFSISYLKKEDAAFYCRNTNNLKTIDEVKVYAKIIKPNNQYSLKDFIPLSIEILLLQNSKTIQRIIKEIDSEELGKALKGASIETQQKVFNNMPKRTVSIFKEDMEYMGTVRKQEIQEAQEKLFDIMQSLEDVGEIVIIREEDEEVV